MNHLCSHAFPSGERTKIQFIEIIHGASSAATKNVHGIGVDHSNVAVAGDGGRSFHHQGRPRTESYEQQSQAHEGILQIRYHGLLTRRMRTKVEHVHII